MDNPSDDIRHTEELTLNAWPSLKQVLYDGWVLRFADGYTRRSNSVNPLHPGSLDLEAKIRFCESAYAAAGLPAVFKLTPASEPAGLSAALAARGYREQARTSVQVADLGDAADEPPAGPAEVKLWHAPEAEWLSAVTGFTGLPSAHHPVMEAILRRIAPPACFAAVACGGETCACGMAVIQGPWLGLFDIVTRAERRRRGFGRKVIGALRAWGRAGGATRAYLQVMLDNPAALALYAGLGFREKYQYVYLVRNA